MQHVLKRAAIVALAVGFVALSACAHKDLLAPCYRDTSFWWSGSALAAASDCGPLLPVNR
jgi:hypothetical protein